MWGCYRTDTGTLGSLLAPSFRDRPDAIALVWNDTRWTYRELWARVEQFATVLADRGVGPETRVGLLSHRRPEMIAALLGVLEAGAAYVPLDPGYPRERLRFMLDDSGVRIVLCDSASASLLRGSDVELLTFASVATASVEPAARHPPDSRQLAYVIYTSGSTGRPKGVAIEHRSASALVRWALVAFSRSELRAVLAATSISFDLSIFEIFVPLAAGERFVLADHLLDVPRLASRNEMSLLNTVPSAAAELLRVAPDLPFSVRAVTLAGELLVRSLADRLFAAGPETVVNLYGPSEDTTYSTAIRLEEGTPGPPPIGFPLPGTRAYVFDRDFEPLAVGEEGEVALGGDGLARGYLGRPALTAGRFVPDPISGIPGSRLYLTGDLARKALDGELDFVGRIDTQVKVRGFRVELGEVEETLVRLPEVADAAVVAVREGASEREDGDSSTPLVALVAYVVPVPGSGGSAAELRRALEASLPDYMVPSLYRLVESLPRTPSGKTDRRRLSELAAAQEGPADFVPGSLQERLCRIWAEVLGVSGVRPEDDFLVDLGGHSLAAFRITGRIRDELKIEMDVRDMLQSRTVEDLEQVLRPRFVGGLAEIPVELIAEEAIEPIGSQAGFIGLDRLEPGQPALHVPVALPLRARLDTGVLDESLVEILDRHEVLRWSFPATRDGIRIEVAPVPRSVLAVVDLSGLSIARCAEQARVRHQVGAAAFDLARGPLFRFVLVSSGAREEPSLLACFHHAVYDGGSTPVLRRELASLYAARLVGDTASPPPLRASFRHRLAWLRHRSRSPEGAEDRRYWQSRLEGAPTDHGLPVRHGRTSPRRFGGRRELRLSQATEVSLRRLARQEETTLFTLLVAGFAALLHRYSGRSDVIVWTPTSGRDSREFEDLIGCFIETVPLRFEIASGAGLRDLVRQARRSLEEALAHRTVGFDEMAREPSPGRGPAARVMFTMLDRLEPDLATDAVWGPPSVPPIPVAGSKLDLTVYAAAGEASFELIAIYDADRFEAIQIARLLAHLVALLEAGAVAPEEALAEIRLERPTGPIAPASPETPCSVVERFDRQAIAGPDRIAVEIGESCWSYEALRRWSCFVAERVMGCAKSAGGRVALLLEPGGFMFAAILGVLRTGRAYVPLEERQPDARLREILRDGDVGVLLASPELLERARGLVVDPVAVEAPRPGEEVSKLGGRLPSPPPEATAYLLYTSGSTGRPKAVVQTQDNVRHHALRYAERIGLGAGDRVTLLSTYGFDAAVMDIFGSLLSGATLCLWDVLSGDFFDLGRWLARRRITVYHSTPTLFRRLVAVLPDAERPGDGPADVRWVVLGGEVVESADAQNFRRAFPPGCRMINGLGPTESTLALQEVVDHQTDLPRATLPVGRPVPGTTVRLLHVGGEQSAVYGVGEIVLAGRRLATGYWRRPALTAEAFVPDPAVPGGRAYRTGDLGRLLPHGKIEFVGRRDQQMKIRGYRVEPGEVEAVLLAERGVREAVVCRLVNERGRDRLGAFWVAEEGVELDQRRLAGRMAAVLPGYMVPSFWLELPEMPLTTSGKVDRRALTELAEEAGDGAEIGGLALASQEAILALAASWKRLLGRPPGPEDDFLRSGGDSLTAIELAGELRGRGWLLAPRQILENPLLSQMISHIEPLRHEAAVDRDEPEGGGPVPFAPLQRYFFGQPQVPERWTVVCAHEAIKGVRSHLLAQAVRELANHHEALALRFTPAACGWSQSAGRPPGEGAVGAGFGVLDLGALPEADRERATRQAAARLQRGFDLASGPLLRVCLVRAEGRPPRLLMVAHHVVADELSLSILREDLEVLYGGLMATGKADLRAKSSGFATWARRAHELSDSGRLEPFRHAWTALPWGRSACLPEARSNGANRRGSVEWVSRDLGEGETAVLLKASSERGVGVDEILLAALARALVSWSGREWWVVHRLWHGRDPAGVLGVDLARTVGCLSALVPILLRLPEASSFDDALLVVRTASDVPPGATARAALLQYSTDSVGDATGPVPPPQIVLNYFGRRSEPTPDGPLRLRPVEQDWGARHPPNAERPYLLGLFAEIAGGSLWLRFDYSAEIHQRATIERLARGLEEDLLDWGARTEAEDRQRSSVASLREGDVV